MILSLAVLVLNDHVLKEAWPGPVTGIASDVAGLALLPVVIVLLVEAAARRPLGLRAVAAMSAVVALGFALVELTALGDAAYEVGLGIVGWPVRAALGMGTGARVGATADALDLLALPAAGLVIWLRRPRRAVVRPRRRTPVVAIVALAVPALLATSQVPDEVSSPPRAALVELGAARPAVAVRFRVEGVGLPGTRPIVLKTSLDGRPDLLVITSVDGREAADVRLAAPYRDEAQLPLGECPITCTFTGQVIIELLDPEAAWTGEIELTAAARETKEGEVSLRVERPPAPVPAGSRTYAWEPAEQVQEQPDGTTKVLRFRGSSEALEAAWDQKPLLLSGYLWSVPGAGAAVHTESCDGNERCERILAFEPANPDAVLAVRAGAPIPGLTVDLVPARWRHEVARDVAPGTVATVSVEVPPGTTLLAGAEYGTADPDGAGRAPVELTATTSTGAAVDGPLQPALTFIERCPAGGAACVARVHLGSDDERVGDLRLDALLVPDAG